MFGSNARQIARTYTIGLLQHGQIAVGTGSVVMLQDDAPGKVSPFALGQGGLLWRGSPHWKPANQMAPYSFQNGQGA
jgi:hypothetical protein